MNKALNFLLSVFFVVGLVAPGSFVLAQTDPAASCAQGGGTWDAAANICNMPTQSASPSPSPSTDPSAACTQSGGTWTGSICQYPTQSASPSPSPSQSSCSSPVAVNCGSGYTTKLVTPPSPQCPYYMCEPTGTSPSPSPTYTSSPSPSPTYSPGTSPQLCPQDQYWDYGKNSCLPKPTYSPGQSPSPYPTYSPGQSPTYSAYPSPQGCPFGEYWDGVKQSCVKPQEPQCNPDNVWDPAQQRCVFVGQETRCGFNSYYDSAQQRCVEFERPKECGPGQYYDFGLKSCQKAYGPADKQFEQPKDIPDGCWSVPDRFGGYRVECKVEKRCAEDDNSFKNKLVLDCVSNGGTPRSGHDPSGCPITQCEFGRKFGGGGFPGKGATGGQFPGEGEFGPQSNFGFFQKSSAICESEESRQKQFETCKKLEQVGVVDFQGGCPVVKCVDKAQFEDLKGHGFEDKYGNLEGQKDVPKDAYTDCSKSGGELVVQKDASGNIEFSDCLLEADDDNVVVSADEVKEVPDSTELLGIATKLGALDIELDKLSKQLAELAKYWKARAGEAGITGLQIAEAAATEETEKDTFKQEVRRYEVASDLLKSAREDLKNLREDISARLDSLTKDDIREILIGVRKIKDVRLKNVVRVMLASNVDELKLTEEVVIDEDSAKKAEEKGLDVSRDFAKRFNFCATTTFKPDPSTTAHFEKKGDSCFVEAKGDFGGTTVEMTCEVPGSVYPKADVREGPDDILPYCKGSMADMLKEGDFTHTEGEGPTGGMPDGVRKLLQEFKLSNPEQLKRVCPQSAENAKKCIEGLGNFLPEDAKQFLTAVAEGRAEAGLESGVPKQIAELMKEFGLSNPEDIKNACPKSKENAKKCLEKLGDLLPPEAKFGLKMLAEGQFPGGGPGSFGPPESGRGAPGEFTKSSLGILPPECQQAGATTPQACEQLMRQKFGGGQFPDSGSGSNYQPSGDFNRPPEGGNFQPPQGPGPQQPQSQPFQPF